MMRQALTWIVLLLPRQDAEVEGLIQKLDDDGFEVREQAQKELVRRGEGAVPALKGALAGAAKAGGRGEFALRLEATLREIDREGRVRAVCREPKRITIDRADAPLFLVLADVANQAGVKIDSAEVEGQRKVTVKAREAPLLEVLDGLCRGQAERTYELRDDGGVKFLREPHPAFPACYEGPFRFRITKVRYERVTDFKEKSAKVYLTFAADHEKYLKPARRYELDLAKATDDQGTSLEIKSGIEGDDFNRLFGGKIVVRVAGGVALADPDTAQSFTLRGLSAGATRVELSGTARFSFPLGHTEVSFTQFDRPETKEVGDFSITLERAAAGRIWTVTFRSAKPAGAVYDEVTQRVDASSVVAVDEDGTEHRADTFGASNETAVFRRPGAQEYGTQVVYQARFTTLRGKGVKAFRFKFVEGMYEKRVPFAFKGVELP